MTSEFYRDLALRYHGEQRYGDHPYGVHLDAVVEILREYGHEALVPAGYLHDTLEDTDATTWTLLSDGVPHDVVEAVEAVTGRGKTRRQRNADIYAKLARTPRAIPLKLANQIANLRAASLKKDSLFEMYRKELFGFRTALGNGEEKPMWREIYRLLGVPLPKELR